jgi:hypothetical protein
MSWKLIAIGALAMASQSVWAQDNAAPTPAVAGQSNVFQNGEMSFQSVLVSNQTIRVNVSFRNITEKPIYLWSSNYREKCATASLVDEKGNEFKCSGESLFPMSPYSDAIQGTAVQPGSAIGLQYQFERGTVTPGEKFEFSASPLLYSKRDTPDNSTSSDRDRNFASETLGVNFSDLPAKVRAVAVSKP